MKDRERNAQLWLAVSEAVNAYLDQNRGQITEFGRYAEDLGNDVAALAMQHMEQWATAIEECFFCGDFLTDEGEGCVIDGHTVCDDCDQAKHKEASA